jgi:membrane dipeptidase
MRYDFERDIELNNKNIFGNCCLGLSTAEEQRARELHESSIIIDTLFQGPCGYRSFSEDMISKLKKQYAVHNNAQKAVLETWALPHEMALRGEFSDLRLVWEASGITGASRQTIGFPATPDSDPYLESMNWFALHQAQFDRFEWLDKALVAEDFRRAKRQGTRVGFLNTQNTLDIGSNLDRLVQFQRFGMRMVQLTYNSVNFVGGGCSDRVDCGVTSFGHSVIKQLNSLGMIVDVSHCGRTTTLDACKLSSEPVVASHLAARGLIDHPRNKADDEIRAIADTGGYVGVYCVPQFLSTHEAPTITALLDHIDYIVNLIGIDHIGIGSDWPLQSPAWGMERLFEWMNELGFDPDSGFDMPKNLLGFDDIRDFPNITRGLVKRGYSDDEIRGVLGENFLRVFEQVCG